MNMDQGHENPENNYILRSGRRLGLGLLVGSLAVGCLDAANQGIVGGLDVAAIYYAPVVFMGATLAITAALGQRELNGL